MDVAPRQRIGGPELLDRGEYFILEPLALLEVWLLLPELRQELADQRGHGRIALGRLDAGAPIDRIGE